MAVERLGPYRLEKLIGRGGMGTVHAARHVETGEQVALKLLAHGIAHEEHFRQRFEAEIQSLIKLDHPNIVRILAYDIDCEQMYFAMELVQGLSLFDELRQGHRFHWREVARIGIEICAALQHAHDRGILHRDLKPGNLLMEPGGRVKLTDFGIAKLFGGRQLTADGGVMGTVDYMSPEQAKGEPTSPRSDLYSLGSLMFALLARRPPFQAKTVPAALQSLSFDAPPLVRDFAPDTPAELEAIIARLLAKNPGARIGSARSVANRLESALAEVRDVPEADSLDHDFDFEDQDRQENGTKSNVASNWNKVTAEQPAVRAGSGFAADAQPTRRAPKEATRATQQAAPRRAEPDSGAGFTEVDENVRRREDNLGKPTDRRRAIWPLVSALILFVSLIVVGIVYANRAPSADQLFEKIQGAIADEDADKVVTVESECRDFLARYPRDSRADQVRQTLDRIELLRYPRQLQRRRQSVGLVALSPAEQFFVTALELSESHPEQAIAQFTALIDLFADDPEAVDCVRAAQKQTARLEELVAQMKAKHAEVLAKQLDLARRLRESDSSSAAKLLRGIIRLYADKSWAENEVRQARELLGGVGDPARQP